MSFSMFSFVLLFIFISVASLVNFTIFIDSYGLYVKFCRIIVNTVFCARINWGYLLNRICGYFRPWLDGLVCKNQLL
jgi:hypothetical protein